MVTTGNKWQQILRNDNKCQQTNVKNCLQILAITSVNKCLSTLTNGNKC